MRSSFSRGVRASEEDQTTKKTRGTLGAILDFEFVFLFSKFSQPLELHSILNSVVFQR